MTISKNKWVGIGNGFCLIRRGFINKYKEIYKGLNNKQKTQYKKYYINFFNSLADMFDNVICNYYNDNIKIIEGVKITKIFYNDFDDEYNYNNDELITLYNAFFKLIHYINDNNNDIFNNIITFKNINEKELLKLLN